MSQPVQKDNINSMIRKSFPVKMWQHMKSFLESMFQAVLGLVESVQRYVGVGSRRDFIEYLKQQLEQERKEKELYRELYLDSKRMPTETEPFKTELHPIHKHKSWRDFRTDAEAMLKKRYEESKNAGH